MNAFYSKEFAQLLSIHVKYFINKVSYFMQICAIFRMYIERRQPFPPDIIWKNY